MSATGNGLGVTTDGDLLVQYGIQVELIGKLIARNVGVGVSVKIDIDVAAVLLGIASSNALP